jgi:hypothetical protein
MNTTFAHALHQEQALSCIERESMAAAKRAVVCRPHLALAECGFRRKAFAGGV